MKKTLKKMFPGLVSLREKQRIYNFYSIMKKDSNIYSRQFSKDKLPFTLFEDKFVMINENTGMDIIYQENKVFNLKLVSKTITNVLIKPGQVFSFWQLARDANKFEAYKDGLIVIDGELTTAPAGGLCHISNLLCWLFLHSPLTFIDRTGHTCREFPNPSDLLIGVDASIMEGISDLKVKNETNSTFQVQVEFDEIHMIGKILVDSPVKEIYKIINKNLHYFRRGGKVYEEVDIVREVYNLDNNPIDSMVLYKNKCEIGYELPSETIINEVI